MNKYVQTLFALLRHSLFDIPYSQEISLSDTEWQALFDLSVRQGVTGLIFDSVESLPKESLPPKQLLYRWVANAETIEQRYIHSWKGASSLSKLWKDARISTIILKGFAFSQYYPKPQLRQCGDFDCFLFEDYEKGNQLAKKAGALVDTHWYKHSQIHYHNILVENHKYLVTTREGKEKKRLESELENLLKDKATFKQLADSSILVPCSLFNALFMAYHSFSHFLSEGIALRHLIDWALFVNKHQNNLEWSTFYAKCREFGFERFIDVETAISKDYLGLSITDPIIQTDSPYTDKVLNSILFDDSKVFSSGKGAWANRFKLVKNMFDYRWKYTEIAHSSFVGHLIRTVWGYLTKKE